MEEKDKVRMKCSVTQIPVNASDAITGHTLQGLTKDNVIVFSWNNSTNWNTSSSLLKLADIKPPSRDYLAFPERMRGLQGSELERARRAS
eukprot:scaffold13446_cov257-Skeletonema_marinoi.AAC.1